MHFLEIDEIQIMLRSWGSVINGGLPRGYRGLGLYRSISHAEDWTQDAEAIEGALSILRSRVGGDRKAKALRLRYASNLIVSDQAKAMKMRREDYKLFADAAERDVMDIFNDSAPMLRQDFRSGIN